jgi:hypothetical protein
MIDTFLSLWGVWAVLAVAYVVIVNVADYIKQENGKGK